MTEDSAKSIDLELSTEESELIISRFNLSQDLITALETHADKRVRISVTPDIAEDLREQAEGLLPLIGFDENYEPNVSGRLLESLIDKFFLG